MDKKTAFLFSAFIAILFYILIVLSFFLYIQKENVSKFKNKSSQTVLEVNIVSEKLKTNDTLKKESSKNTLEPKKEKTIVKKSTTSKPKKVTDLKSLFAGVSTKSSKIITKTVSTTKASQVESRFKSKYDKQRKVKEVQLSKLVDIKNTKLKTNQKHISQNSNGTYHKYYSKINDLILTKWYNYSLLNNHNYLVVVNITIDRQGKFSYHIISLSGLTNVDNSIKVFLENQRLETYPVSPDKQTKTIKLNFKPDITN